VILVRLCRSFTLAGFMVLAAVMAGCDDSPTAPSGSGAFSQTDLRAGTGASAESGSVLTVHYTGWLYDGSQSDLKGLQFETSRGGQGLAFILGAGQVIAGWDQGLVGMRAGGLRRLVIPPSLAYGGTRNGPIPPNATLVFEVELLDVQ
jgi:FKBP-type peptidyl-prolyl cis-trans isomerase FkpA